MAEGGRVAGGRAVGFKTVGGRVRVGRAADISLGSILTITLEGCEGCLGLGLNPLNRITQVLTMLGLG